MADDADGENMYINDMCVTKAHADGSPMEPMRYYYAPSDEFCAKLTEHGFPSDACQRNCTVGYVGSVSLNITTGGDDGHVLSCGARAPMSVNKRGSGASWTYVDSPDAGAHVSINAGSGPGIVTLVGDFHGARVDVDAGRDGHVDRLRILSDTCCTAAHTSTTLVSKDNVCGDAVRRFGPLGPAGSEVVARHLWANDAEACAAAYNATVADVNMADLPGPRAAAGQKYVHFGADIVQQFIDPKLGRDERGVCRRVSDSWPAPN